MKTLLGFLHKQNAQIVFISLSFLSLALFFHQAYHRAAVAWTTASIYRCINEIKSYPRLKKENAALLQEVAALQAQLLEAKIPEDTLSAIQQGPYALLPAQVVNNAIVGTKNYLTINKGALHGIAPGMGVVSSQGIVGKVKAVSDHFATIISLLHTSMQVSAKIAPADVLGTVQWTGKDPTLACMRYVPRHVVVAPGDAVVTSGYNHTFFADASIGHITQVKLRKEAPFYDIELRFSTNFSTLRHVYVVQYTLKQEKETLEQHTHNFYE